MGQWKWFFSLWKVRMPTWRARAGGLCELDGMNPKTWARARAATPQPLLRPPQSVCPQPHLAEVAGVVLVHVDAVVVLTASIATA